MGTASRREEPEWGPSGIAGRLRAWRELRRTRSREHAEVEMRNRRIDDGTIWRSGKGGGHQR